MGSRRWTRSERARLYFVGVLLIALLPLSSDVALGRSVSRRFSDESRNNAVGRSPERRWQLTWSDEFSGPQSLRKWTFYVGGSTQREAQLEWYDRNNVAISKRGQLVVTASDHGYGHECWYGHCQYTSARMETRGIFSQAYGRFEARIKLPVGQGIWPAFWLEGANVDAVPWPLFGEIDIIEKNGHKPGTVEGFAHGPDRSHDAYLMTGRKLSSGYHIYGVDWTPRGITWFFDGRAYSHLTAYPNWPFDHKFFLIIDLAVGGRWPGPPNASTRFPVHMLVDWVRVYRAVTSPGASGRAPPAVQSQVWLQARY